MLNYSACVLDIQTNHLGYTDVVSAVIYFCISSSQYYYCGDLGSLFQLLLT